MHTKIRKVRELDEYYIHEILKRLEELDKSNDNDEIDKLVYKWLLVAQLIGEEP